MRHTNGCRQVLDDQGFPETEYRRIEQILTKHTPKQVAVACKRADKDGNHADFEYFEPMFVDYVPEIDVLEGHDIVFDNWFWEAYDYLAQFVVEDFHVTDMVMIAEMTNSMERLKLAVGKSKQNIRYVFKVYSGMEEETTSVRVTPADVPKLGNKGVKTDDLT